MRLYAIRLVRLWTCKAAVALLMAAFVAASAAAKGARRIHGICMIARERIAAAGYAVMRWSDRRDAALGEE